MNIPMLLKVQNTTAVGMNFGPGSSYYDSTTVLCITVQKIVGTILSGPQTPLGKSAHEKAHLKITSTQKDYLV